jgi:hypothetical protein
MLVEPEPAPVVEVAPVVVKEKVVEEPAVVPWLNCR